MRFLLISLFLVCLTPAVSAQVTACPADDPYCNSPIRPLENLIDTVHQMNLNNGLESSLDAKLSVAIAALEDKRANNDDQACHKIVLFQNEVQAQVGRFLEEKQALTLLWASNEILWMMGCPVP